MLTIHRACSWTLLVALVVIASAAVAPVAPAAAQTAALPAFPGAQGYGAISKGGRGGRVILVKNLNDSGSGSLREALSASGPRIIVFRVGGVIALSKPLEVDDPYVTIAGQTAPGDGIIIRNHPLAIRTHDVTVRGLRVRIGVEQTRDNDTDGIKLTTLGAHGNVENVIIDHSSISWAGDEQLSFYNTNKVVSSDGSERHYKNGTLRNITVQWSVVSEGLRDTIANQGTSYAALICDYVENISLHHNLMAHHTDRSPAINADVTAEVVNNVVYNWGSRGTILSGFGHGVKQPSLVNVIGNFYKKGPDTYKGAPKDRGIELEADFAADAGSSGWNDTASRFHVRGNVGPNRPENTGAEWNAVYDELAQAVANDDYRATRRVGPLPAFPVTEHTAAESYKLVLDRAGATVPQRDAVDERAVADVRNVRGRIIEHVGEVGGFPRYNDLDNTKPPADTDSDGMPDSWESEHGLNPKLRNDALGSNTTAPSGYMWVEEYLNSLFTSGPDDGGDYASGPGADVGEWSTIGGRWPLASDSSLRQANTSGITVAVAQSQLPADYIVEAQATPTDYGSDGNVALYARFQDTNNFYRLHVATGDTGNIALRRRYKGSNTTLKVISRRVSEGETYRLKLEVRGQRIRAYLNGELVADVTDSTFSRGKIGVGTYNASSRFDNVTVR